MIRITIEGPQGSGKSRLASLIVSQLQNLGHKQIRLTDDGTAPFPYDKAQLDAEVIVQQTKT